MDKNARRDGFVLIAVIWFAGLIAVVAAGFAVTTRVNVLTGANIVHNAEAAAAADGMARLIAFRLAAEPAALAGLSRDGAVTLCRWDDRTTVGIAIQDQGGLIDLNAAPETLLERLIAGLGAPGEAAALAAAIADFRDVDGDATAGVFEPDTYNGMEFGPKNAPFQAVEELDQLPGVSESLYRRLLPLTTVNSAQPGFDPAVAPAALKQALGLSAASLPPEIAGLALASAGQTFGLDIMAVSASGARYRRLALVSLVRQPDRPFAILSWQRGGDFELVGTAERPCFN
jgi:general secretion pathway protein K